MKKQTIQRIEIIALILLLIYIAILYVGFFIVIHERSWRSDQVMISVDTLRARAFYFGSETDGCKTYYAPDFVIDSTRTDTIVGLNFYLTRDIHNR